MDVEEAWKMGRNPHGGSRRGRGGGGGVPLQSPAKDAPQSHPTMCMKAITYQLTPLCQQSRSRAHGLCRGERWKFG